MNDLFIYLFILTLNSLGHMATPGPMMMKLFPCLAQFEHETLMVSFPSIIEN
jgi:hypothetical protein